MNFFDQSYYKASTFVTSLIGLWPYEERRRKNICRFITISLCMSQFFAEILGVIKYADDKEIVLESITPFIIDAGMAIKYINAVINMKTMIELLERLENNWAFYTKEEEKRILNKYAYIGQLMVYGYIGFVQFSFNSYRREYVAVYITILVFVTEPLMPKWINFILQLNGTIPNKYPVPIYWYIIDMEYNFYSILCFEAICIVAILTITVANDSMFMVFLQHACALFDVAGHQLENLPNNDELKKNWNYDKKSRKTNDIQYEYYVMCIKSHKRAIEFADLLEDLYVWSFGLVIALNMPIMSITAVQIVSQADTIQKKIKYSMFACTQLMHLFFDCYLSQQLTDCSTAIQQHITYSKWYKISLKSQKLATLVTLRSQSPCKLTAGKLVELSMETFGVIVKTSASYFTVMISMR